MRGPPRGYSSRLSPALRRTVVEPTRPIVEGYLAQHPRQHPSRLGLAEPATLRGPLFGVCPLDDVGGRRLSPSRAGPAVPPRLRVLGSNARRASHAPLPSVPLSPAGL